MMDEEQLRVELHRAQHQLAARSSVSHGNDIELVWRRPEYSSNDQSTNNNISTNNQNSDRTTHSNNNGNRDRGQDSHPYNDGPEMELELSIEEGIQSHSLHEVREDIRRRRRERMCCCFACLSAGCITRSRVCLFPTRWPAALDVSFDNVRDRTLNVLVIAVIIITLFVDFQAAPSEQKRPFFIFLSCIGILPVFMLLLFVNNPFLQRRLFGVIALLSFGNFQFGLVYRYGWGPTTFEQARLIVIWALVSLADLALLMMLRSRSPSFYERRKQVYSDYVHERLSERHTGLIKAWRDMNTADNGSASAPVRDAEAEHKSSASASMLDFECGCGALRTADICQAVMHLRDVHGVSNASFASAGVSDLLVAQQQQHQLQHQQQQQQHIYAAAQSHSHRRSTAVHAGWQNYQTALNVMHHKSQYRSTKRSSIRERRRTTVAAKVLGDGDGDDAGAGADRRVMAGKPAASGGGKSSASLLSFLDDIESVAPGGDNDRVAVKAPLFTPSTVIVSTLVTVAVMVLVLATMMDTIPQWNDNVQSNAQQLRQVGSLATQYASMMERLVNPTNVTLVQAQTAALNSSANDARSYASQQGDANTRNRINAWADNMDQSQLQEQQYALLLATMNSGAQESLGIQNTTDIVAAMRVVSDAATSLAELLESTSSNLAPSMYAATFFAFSASIAAAVYALFAYQRTAQLVHFGRGSELGPTYQPDLFTTTRANQFLGVQFSSAFVGFAIIASFVFAVLFLLTWSHTYEYLFSDEVLPFVWQYGVMFVFKLLILDYFLGRRVLSDGYLVKSARTWTWFSGVMFLFNFITGVVSALLRFAVLTCVALLALLRLDVSIFPQQLLSLDAGFTSYMSVVLFQHRHLNPVEVAASDQFLRSTRGEARHEQIEGEKVTCGGLWSSIKTVYKQFSSDDGPAAQAPRDVEPPTISTSRHGVSVRSMRRARKQTLTHQERRSERARFRWHLLYNMIHIPNLRFHRKHYLAQVRNNNK